MLLCYVGLAVTAPAAAQSPVAYDERLPAPVAAALNAAGISQASVAVLVQEVGVNLPRVSVNAGRSMNPASVMKLLTTYAALELLGPAYTWRTEAYATGAIDNGMLAGDLILKGHGDPKLNLESFWLLLRQLRARGLRDIQGDLVLDRSHFARVDHDPGGFDQEPLRPYNVGPDALLLNFKSVRFQFVPDADRQTVALLAEPQPVQLDVVNLVKLGAGPCNDWRAALRPEFFSHDGNARLVFTGIYPAACGEKTWHFGLLDHPQYVHGVFRQLWQELGGSLGGGLRDGAVPPGARLLAASESPALAEVVRDINKFSNNVMARQVFLTLSAETLKLPGRYDRSARVVQSWLAGRGLEMPELVIENGSGLSRAGRISAGSLARLLVAAYRSSVMPEFVASLPLVAYDGTLRKRMKFESVAGQAHVKTGSLSDVRAIAGYVLDRNARRHALVFIVNHANAGAGQAAQDAVLRWTYESGR